MKYLTPQQVLVIHDYMVKRFGVSYGIRDISLIESAVAHPMAACDGIDLYKNIFDKAVVLLLSLLKKNLFMD